jgi:ribosomal silencing factor RsfS
MSQTACHTTNALALNASMRADIRSSPPTSFLNGDPAVFRDLFDSRAYTFGHRLAGHPLFERDKLLRLTHAMRQNPRDIFYDAGDVGVGQRWDAVPRTHLTPEELFERIETAGAWIILRRADRLPEYAALLDQCIAEIEALSGREWGPLMQLKAAIIFINSPRRISSYHIDRECNWLLQIAGEKVVHVFDKNDRTVLPEEEIERFWALDPNSAIYKPDCENRATVVPLKPGDGVHIPVGAPHWVQNGDQVSVSLSINFHYKESFRADIYRANHYLRRFGFVPTPPGRSAIRDSFKRTVFRPMFGARNWLRRHSRGKESRMPNRG